MSERERGRGSRARARAPHLEVRLLVRRELAALVGGRQVDGEVRDAQQRPLDVHELLRERAVGLLDDDGARERELPVEPRVPQPAAVGLDVDLNAAVRALLGAGLELEHGRIRVRAHDVEAVARLEGRSDLRAVFRL